MSLGMNSVGLNQPYSRQIAMRANSEQTVQAQEQVQTEKTLMDSFTHEHKKNGLVERAYNGVKNLTGLGTGSKKVKAVIAKAENGEISEEEAQKTIDKYRLSQQTSAQILGDGASIATGAFAFFKLRQALKFKNAEVLLNEKHYQSMINMITDVAGKKNNVSKITQKILDIGKSNTKMMAVTALGAALVAGLTKNIVSKVNRIGSKEFKVDKKDFNGAKTAEDKKAYKAAKKAARKAKRRANLRNFTSGAINGITMPLTMIGGGYAGVPLYLAGNTLNRYFVGTKTDDKKSMSGYIENLKNDAILHAGLAIGAAIPLVKSAQFQKVFDANIKKATDKLLKADIQPNGFEGRTAYNELEEIIFKDEKIKSIIDNTVDKDGRINLLTVEDQIKNLTDENILAVKMKQISSSRDALTEALEERCPATRCFKNADGTWDFSKAQQYLDDKLGKGYEVKKCLGVGTIAETYLVKDKNGKDVCVKLVKEGISAEKIEADAQKFIKIIENMTEKSDAEKKYLINNIKDLAAGVKKEVDFQNEFDAAKELVKHCKTANVVKPIEVKNGVYIMEKAEGISLSSLIKLNSKQRELDWLQKRIKDLQAGKLEKWDEDFIRERNIDRQKFINDRLENTNNWIKEIQNDISLIQSRTPQYGDINLDDKDAKKMFKEYMKVITEQFYKVDKNGKVLHADIHPGNIFIDINALRSGKGNVFTLIDTGNTIKLSQQQGLASLKLTTFLERGSAKDIADYMLDGADFSACKLSEAEVKEKIVKELENCFFGENVSLPQMTNDKMQTIVSNIMRKYDVMPGNTQLNLQKARTSSDKSLIKMLQMWFENKGSKIEQKESNLGKAAEGMSFIKDYVNLINTYRKMQKNQEKLNLLQLSPAERIKYNKNPNLLKKNDEKYFIYKLKQMIKRIDEQ